MYFILVFCVVVASMAKLTDIYIYLDTHLKSWRVSIMVGETVYKTFSQDPNTKG